ncbi:MAG TPA: dihydrolipoamide acetyltransferase family protein [Anaerolineae bacterium]|nr:dihydrolipoamide acetyltransferase family protein [Anaerolineae bacterium]
MGTQVIMPQLGESVVEGKVSRWLKQVGDPVKLYEPILEVETDKVTTEVTAAGEGTLLKLYANEGDVVKAGTLIAFIGAAGESVPAHGDGAAHGAPIEVTAPVAAQRGNGSGARISPVVARIASEHNVDVSLIHGTGEGGRVTKKDILAYIGSPRPQEGESHREAALGQGVRVESEKLEAWEQPGLGELFRPTEEVFGKKATPATAHSAPIAPAATPAAAPGDVMPLNNMRKAIAEHMVMSKRTSPHVTTVFEVDLSKVVAHRAKHKAAFERDGANLTFTPYFALATIAALKKYPLVNSSWSDGGIVLHRTVNLGIAVSLGEEGLIVPVIKNADSLNLLGLARTVNDLADRARRKQLKPDEVQGGTFTITNHGTSGSLFATPIINQPQCGILGVGQIQKRVVVVTQNEVDAIAIRPMVYVGLTFDHRILDGNSADSFVAAIKGLLESWA